MGFIRQIIDFITDTIIYRIKSAIGWYITSAIIVIIVICVLCFVIGYAVIAAYH